jgi:hypothetical protein
LKTTPAERKKWKAKVQEWKTNRYLRKTEESLENRIKSYEWNMQEFSDSIKRPRLWIIGIIEEVVHAKSIGNTFNKVIAENSPNLKKQIPTQLQDISRTPNKYDQNRTST